MQQHQWQRRQQQREFPPRFLWAVLILLASLAAVNAMMMDAYTHFH